MKRFVPILLVAALLSAQNPVPQNPVPQTPVAVPEQTAAQQPPPANMVLNLPNASLREVIDMLARRLKINYIIDKRVNGEVTMQTYGEIKGVDVRSLLETILRINGAAMVQVGDIFRIVPTTEVIRLPINPSRDTKDLPDDDRMVMNLIFLKYVTVSEVQKLLDQFMGEGAKSIAYDPANLLIILDNARSMRRTMDMLSLFDNDVFANQRVRLFETANGRPTDIVKELEAIFKGISLGEKSNGIKFMPLDRINTIIAVAPNPGIFADVEKWLGKLDIPVKAPVGAVDNWVYRVKYGEASILSQAVMALYSGDPYMLMMLSQMGMFSSGGGACSGGGGGFGGQGGGGFGGQGGGFGGQGGGFGGGGFGGGMGAYGGGMNPMMMGGMGMMGMMGGGFGGGYGGGGYGSPYGTPYGAATQGRNPMSTPGAGVPGAPGTDQTGGYLSASGTGAPPPRAPRVVPNPFDNSLLIQGTPQEYEQIVRLLRQLDIAPRQVLIEARIYEVTLSGAFSSGVQAFLQRRGTASGSPSDGGSASRQFLATATGTGALLTAGLLVGRSRELLAFLNVQETQGRSKTIASPSIIATDNCQASITVGTDVPTLTSQAVSGIQQSGTSLFTNQVQNRSAGVNFSIKPKVLPSGIVTLEINQDISSPIPPSPGAGIQSPSFSRRNVSTRVTVQDGDTVAIAGIIQEAESSATAGLPGLHKLPIVGALFGNRSSNKARTELVIFMTPRVIYDTNDIADASEEVRSRLKRLQKIIRE